MLGCDGLGGYIVIVLCVVFSVGVDGVVMVV